MSTYQVTQLYSWTFEVEAESEDEAISKAQEMELSGGDLISDGYLDTTVEIVRE